MWVYVNIKIALILALIISAQSITALERCESIELVTFNLRNGLIDDGKHSWQYRLPVIESTLREIKPGIIAVQEALTFQVDAILKFLPEYVAVGLGRNGEMNGESNAIIYDSNQFSLNSHQTLWLSDTPTIPSKHWGNNYLRIVTIANLHEITSGRSFYVLNMHWDHESQTSREKSAEVINTLIANKVDKARSKAIPIFVMGDLNATENNIAIQKLQQESMLQDSLKQSAPYGTSSFGTFHQFSGKDDGPRIDYIFYRGNVELTDASVIKSNIDGTYPSDHFPVAAYFDICAN